MLKNIVRIILVLLICQDVVAQMPDRPNTLLFKVSHPDSPVISYLFGTHHAFGKAFFDSLTPANTALAECSILLTETDPNHLSSTEIINKRTRDTEWKKYFNKQDLEYLDTLFSVSDVALTKLSPAELYTALNRKYNERVCGAKAEGDSHISLDEYIQEKGKKLGLKLAGFESPALQLEFINRDIEGMPIKVHKKRLRHLLELFKTENPANCQDVGWYSKMDYQLQLEKACTNALMLTNRNDQWMKTIVPEITKNRCFIAVGLSHLMFECGLISQLQEMGFVVEPVLIN